MNFRNTVLAAGLAALLAACGGGSSEPGIEVSLRALAQDAPTAAPGTATVFRRADGMKIELELGLLNLVPVELQRCQTLSAAALLRALDPLPRAHAHGGHSGEPPAGAVNVTADGGESDLGSLSAEPGTYCGVVVELQPGTGVAAKHGAALDTDMTGSLLNVAPCYYDGSQNLSDAQALAFTSHRCIQAKVKTAARRVTLPFAAPVTLDAQSRNLALTVVTRHQEWFDGIDFTTLASSSAEQAKLLDNVLASLHAHTQDEQPVSLGFKLAVAGEEAVCGQTYTGLGSTGANLRMEGFRFYVSNLALKNATGEVPVTLDAPANGTVLQTDDTQVALIGHTQGCDAPQGLRQLVLGGSAPAGNYDQLCFDLGVPFEAGHSDVTTAPSPLDVTGMAWTWLSGRIFFRFDAVADAQGTPRNFFVHLGSTGCSNGGTSNPNSPPSQECVNPNRPRICLPYAPIAQGQPIVADIAPMISEVDVTQNTAQTAPGCMSGPGDPECTSIVPKFGLDFPLSPNTLIPRRSQALFTVGG